MDINITNTSYIHQVLGMSSSSPHCSQEQSDQALFSDDVKQTLETHHRLSKTVQPKR